MILTLFSSFSAMLIQAVVQKQKNTRPHRAHARRRTGVLFFKTRPKLLFRTTVLEGGRKFVSAISATPSFTSVETRPKCENHYSRKIGIARGEFFCCLGLRFVYLASMTNAMDNDSARGAISLINHTIISNAKLEIPSPFSRQRFGLQLVKMRNKPIQPFGKPLAS